MVDIPHNNFPKECRLCRWRSFVPSRKQPGSHYFCGCIQSEYFGYLDWDRPQPHTCNRFAVQHKLEVVKSDE